MSSDAAPWADVAQWAVKHWHWIATGLGGGGALTFLGRHLYKRLQPDQQACVDAVENLELAADALEMIVGRPDTVTEDCVQARAANKYRRRAGTLIKDLYPGQKFDGYRTRLTELDRKLRDVEDRIAAGGPQASVRDACDDARGFLHTLRMAFNRQAASRWSVRFFGRRRFDSKPAKD